MTWRQAGTDRSWRGVAIRGDHEDFILFEAELRVRLNAGRPRDVGEAFVFVIGELAYGDSGGKAGPSAGPGVFVFSLGAPAERASAPRAEVAGPSR